MTTDDTAGRILGGDSDGDAPAPRRRAGGRAATARAPCRRSGHGPSRGSATAPTEVLSADELESIHRASLRVLAEIGMDFLDDGPGTS